jgi:hypothetical protein
MIPTALIALPSSFTGRPFSNETTCRSGAFGFVNASFESTQALSGMLPDDVSVSVPLESFVSHRREHFEIRRERAQRHFEAHLIVAGRGAAVRDHAGAELARHAGNRLRLHHALRANAKRVELAAAHVPHDEKAQHLLEVIRPRVDDVMLHRAERLRALRERSPGGLVDAAGIHRYRDDGAVVVLGHPRHEERRIQTAGISEDDGLCARISSCVGHD